MFDVEKIRNDFPMIRNNPELAYFDSGATSFKPQCVIDKVCDYYSFFNTNIHRGDYDLSHKVSKEYDDTRKIIRDFLKADDERCIVYTAGDTASLNTVAFGYGEKFLKKGDVVLTSLLEHASDILPWFALKNKIGIEIRYIPLNDNGTVDMERFEECFSDGKVRIVSLTYVSNVLGYVNPIKDICKIAHRYNAIVNVDGAQAVPHLPVDVNDLDVDFLSFSSHKMCGPAGIGVLYGKKEYLDAMDPIAFGGGANARFDKETNIILKETPEKFEAGTPNIEGVLGLGEAIGYLESIGMKNIEEYCKELTVYFMSKLKELDNVKIYNLDSDTGIVAFNIKGIFAQDAASYFSSKNIAVRSGNHCAKIIHNVIEATETIRASMYFYNTKEEIDRFIEVIKETTIEKCVDSIL